jgi:hypothetical protein
MKLLLGAFLISVMLAGCAGRDPNLIPTVQVSDQQLSCMQIAAEIKSNNEKISQLASEQGWKVAQNVTAGIVGLVVWPVWFGMDFKDAAGKEVTALSQRNQYLGTLAGMKCAGQTTASLR